MLASCFIFAATAGAVVSFQHVGLFHCLPSRQDGNNIKRLRRLGTTTTTTARGWVDTTKSSWEPSVLRRRRRQYSRLVCGKARSSMPNMTKTWHGRRRKKNMRRRTTTKKTTTKTGMKRLKISIATRLLSMEKSRCKHYRIKLHKRNNNWKSSRHKSIKCCNFCYPRKCQP